MTITTWLGRAALYVNVTVNGLSVLFGVVRIAVSLARDWSQLIAGRGDMDPIVWGLVSVTLSTLVVYALLALDEFIQIQRRVLLAHAETQETMARQIKSLRPVIRVARTRTDEDDDEDDQTERKH